MKRIIRPWLWLSLGALALLLAGTLLVAAWLLGSTSGSRWLLDRAPVPEWVGFEITGGSIYHGLAFSGLRIQTGETLLTARRGDLTVRPMGLLNGVVIKHLLLEDMMLTLTPGPADDDSPPLDLAGWTAPLPIRLEHGEIRGLTLSIEPDQSFTATELTLSGFWDQALTGLRLSLDSDAVQLTTRGDVALAQGTTQLELQLSLDGRRIDPALPGDLQLRAVTRTGLDDIVIDLSSRAAELSAEGVLSSLLTAPQLELQLSLGHLDLPGNDAPLASLVQVSGALSLTPDEYRASLQGGLLAIELLDVPDPLPWRMVVHGDLSGDIPGVDLEMLELDAGPGNVLAHGQVRLGGADDSPPSLELDLEWNALQWPLTGDQPLLGSSEGRGRLSGHADAWRFDGGFSLTTPDYPGGQLTLQAHGDSASAEFDALEAVILGGSIKGQGSLAWSGALESALDLNFTNLDLAPVLPDWPARVSGDLSVSLQGGDTLQTLISVQRLEGSLFDEPLSFSGDLSWAADGLGVRDAALQAGPSRIRGNGFWGPEWYASFALNLHSPGWLADMAGGNWAGNIELDNRTDFPLRAADLVAENIAFDGVTMNRLVLQRDAATPADLSLEVSGLTLDDLMIDELRLSITGARDAQVLTFNARLPDWDLSASSRGRLLGEKTLQDTGWVGQLDELKLRRADQPLFSLSASAPLELTPGTASLNDACLAFNAGGALCLSVEQVSGESLDITGEFRSLSLAVLEQLSVTGLASTQVLDGPVNWFTRSGEGLRGSADLRLSPGTIYDPAEDEFDIEVGPGTLGFNLEDGALRNGRIDLPLPGAGHIRSAFEIDGVRLDGTGQLRGDLDVTLENLQLLDEFLDPVEALKGSLRLSLVLSGVTADPRFDGIFDLSGVSFLVPAMGTEVSALSLRGRVDNADRLSLRGSFEAGEGDGTLSAEAGFRDWSDLRLDLRLKGENLALIRVPDLALDVSPDIQMAYQQERWEVSGTTLIPRATLTPLTIGVDRVDESPDVVVVAGELPETAERNNQRPAQIDGSIAITLGDDVNVVMDKADLNLSGAVELLWNGDMIPAGQGEIRINGDVTAWGPRLVIDGGRVRWAGETVSNPQLDIRAEQDVFGNTLIRTAGVRVSGSARNPDVEAFTRPLTTSERAWAVLLTGSDVNFARGVGAFDVGTYIAPRIFLSYGISFFDSDNVVGIRYDLRRGWGIKATSGQQDSGVDLSYTIED